MKICILYGGYSKEREISLRTGRAIFDSINAQFDVFLYDFGMDGKAGDGYWDDLQGDGEFQVGESLNSLLGTFGDPEDVGLDGLPNTNDYGEGDGIWQPGDGWIDVNGNGFVDLGSFGESGYDAYVAPDQNNYDDVWPPKNGLWDEGEIIYDYGQDGLPDTGDFGENDDILKPVKVRYSDADEVGKKIPKKLTKQN